MSINQEMQDQKAQLEIRLNMEKSIEQFCCKMKLKADEREDTIQFVVYKIDQGQIG